MPLKVVPLSNELPGFAPLPHELVTGELALNTSDGVLYTKLADGTITSVCCGSAANPVGGGFYSGECSECRALAAAATEVAAGSEALSIVRMSWVLTSGGSGTCQRSVDHYEIEYNVDPVLADGAWTHAGKELSSASSTSFATPLTHAGTIYVRVVPVTATGVRGNAPAFPISVEVPPEVPPPPPPPTMWECRNNHPAEISGGPPDFVTTFPTAAEVGSCDPPPPPVESWTCSGTTCTHTPGVAPDGITHFASSVACTTACVESWTCSGTTCTHTPGVAPDIYTHYATSLLCTAACQTPDPLSYTCDNGQCVPSLVAPDNVTFFETAIGCDVRCAEPTGFTSQYGYCQQAMHTLSNGQGELDWPARWFLVSPSTDQPCRLSTVFAGWAGDGVTPIYAPTVDNGNGLAIASDGTRYTARPGGGFMRLPPVQAIGPCNAQHPAGESHAYGGLPCTVYNPAP